MSLRIINLPTVLQLKGVCLSRTQQTLPLTLSVKKRTELAGRKGIVQVLEQLRAEAERNAFYYVTTRSLVAGFPITNCCLSIAEARAPAPS